MMGTDAVLINLTISTYSVIDSSRTDIFYKSMNDDSAVSLSLGIITMSMSDSDKHSSVAKDPKMRRVAPEDSLIFTVIFSISSCRNDFWY